MSTARPCVCIRSRTVIKLIVNACIFFGIVSNIGGDTSGGRSFSSGNRANSVVTEEGLTVVLVKGNICDQTVSCKTR